MSKRDVRIFVGVALLVVVSFIAWWHYDNDRMSRFLSVEFEVFGRVQGALFLHFRFQFRLG